MLLVSHRTFVSVASLDAVGLRRTDSYQLHAASAWSHAREVPDGTATCAFLLSGIASIEDGLRVVTIAVTRATRSS